MEDLLLKRAQQGDQQAFQRLVEMYSPLAWRTACALLSDRLLAEDALQESWLDVWKGLNSFRGGPFRPWLLTIIANRSRKMVRSSRMAMVFLQQEEIDTLVDEESTQQMSRLETNDELKKAFLHLSSDQKRVLELHFFAELELAEIALVTNVSLGTVKSRLHRALERLRTKMPLVDQSMSQTTKVQ